MDDKSKVRVLSGEKAQERNRIFNQQLQERGCCLAVARTWGNRTLSTKSTQWKRLKQRALLRYNHACRFCGLSASQGMVCDHINGDASDNRLENLGINCAICDLLRHCGRAGMFGDLLLCVSQLSQLEIV